MADSSRPAAEPEAPVLAATPARQGRYGRPVFWVLVISTLLAAIGLFLAWTWKSPSLNAAQTRVTDTHNQAAGSFSAPEPAPVSAPPTTDNTAPQPR